MEVIEERLQKQREYLAKEEKKELLENSGLIESFKKDCATKGLILTESNFRYITTIGVVAAYPDIITYLNPSLVRDKEELYDYGILSSQYEKKKFAGGFLYGNNYMLMANHYFRRGFHPNANFAPRFTQLFWNFQDPNIQQYISLDTDRVRINVDNKMYLEEDTWYGASFNKFINQVPDGVAKLGPPMDLGPTFISMFFDDIHSLDIKWSTNGDIKSFYAEEFKTEDITISIQNNLFHPAKYIHAEFDLTSGHFRHFDGAIHFYTQEEYLIRKDSDFNYNAKHSQQIKSRSQKLFKMNGVIKVDTWMEFVSHFLTGNPLVFEYFEGNYPGQIKEIVEVLRNKNKLNR